MLKLNLIVEYRGHKFKCGALKSKDTIGKCLMVTDLLLLVLQGVLETVKSVPTDDSPNRCFIVWL